MDKAELRRRARAARRAVGPERVTLDVARYERILGAGIVEDAETVAAYIADDGEADPLPWRHVAEGRRVVLPVAPIGSRSLRFFAASGPADLVPGRWGIPEPQRAHPVAIADIEVLLVPLVAFDINGGRLGRGAGFYDATVGPAAELIRRPLLVGIAHDGQEVDVVPTHERDLRLDAVATPTRLVWCPSRWAPGPGPRRVPNGPAPKGQE